jgi:hypothetical protein
MSHGKFCNILQRAPRAPSTVSTRTTTSSTKNSILLQRLRTSHVHGTIRKILQRAVNSDTLILEIFEIPRLNFFARALTFEFFWIARLHSLGRNHECAVGISKQRESTKQRQRHHQGRRMDFPQGITINTI